LNAILIRIAELKRRQGLEWPVHLELEELRREACEVQSEIRQLLYDLRGQATCDEDLVPALRGTLLPRLRHRFNVKVRLHVSRKWPADLPVVTTFNLYRLVQEAVTNAVRHGRAKSIMVSLAVDQAGALTVSVADDGTGLPEFSEPGLGLRGMHERVASIGGRITAADADGGGFEVHASLPCAPVGVPA
jgi:signal transduction histidine kinase